MNQKFVLKEVFLMMNEEALHCGVVFTFGKFLIYPALVFLYTYSTKRMQNFGEMHIEVHNLV